MRPNSNQEESPNIPRQNHVEILPVELPTRQQRPVQLEIIQTLRKKENGASFFLIRQSLFREDELTTDLASSQQDEETKEAEECSSPSPLEEEVLHVMKTYDHRSKGLLRALTEIELAAALPTDSQNIAKVLRCEQTREECSFADSDNEIFEFPQGYSMMLQEYCGNQNILEDLPSLVLSTTQIKSIFKQLAQTVGILHEKYNIALLNLHKTNITSSYIPKLHNFSTAQRTLQKIMAIEVRSLIAHKCLQPPEIICFKTKDLVAADKIDVFMMGVLLFFAVFNGAPFTKAAYDDVLYKYLSGNTDGEQNLFWMKHQKTRKSNRLSENLKSLLCAMMHPHPTQRPSMSEVADHIWFNIEE